MDAGVRSHPRVSLNGADRCYRVGMRQSAAIIKDSEQSHMPYYPEQTFVIGLTTIRRERRLPPGAIGQSTPKEGQHVEAQDVVLQGALPGRYIILDAVRLLGLRRPEDLTEAMLVRQVGDTVDRGQIIARNGNGRGAKTIKAPTTAIFTAIEDGQLVLQANPEPIDIYAMCPGDITSVRGTGEILLETVGALIQCAWGNGKRAFSSYRMEPEEGIESLNPDNLTLNFRSNGIILTKSIQSQKVFTIARQNEIAAIIAPSMHADLRESALRQTIPIILTAGFGEQQMSDLLYNPLRDNLGRPAMFDATEPTRWSSSRPEIVIPLPAGVQPPPPPEADQALEEGVLVRLVRAPFEGMSGRVRRVVDTPRSVENGLRLPGAEVQLANGRTVFVPLANIEMLGRAADA